MKSESFDLKYIRRTCETMLASMGISRVIRAQLLSHGISGGQAYTDERCAALVAWKQSFEDIATGKKPGGFFPIKPNNISARNR